MTLMNSKPASSAVLATVARSAPSRAGPPGRVKSGICSPIFTRSPPRPSLPHTAGAPRAPDAANVGDHILPARRPGAGEDPAGRGARPADAQLIPAAGRQRAWEELED